MPKGAQGPVAADSIENAHRQFREAKLALLRAKVALDKATLSRDDDGSANTQAILMSLQLSTAILQIENAQVGAVAARVEDNSEKLVKATDNLREMVEQSAETAEVINGAGELLRVVAAILAL